MDKLDALVDRLEKAVVKLETRSGRGGGDDAEAEFVTEYKSVVLPSLAQFKAASKALDPEMEKFANQLEELFVLICDALVMVSKHKKPSGDAAVAAAFTPLSSKITEFQGSVNKCRKMEFINHTKALSAVAPACGWVSVPSRPGNFIKEMVDSAIFYSNKVLSEFKDKDPKHKEWVTQFIVPFKKMEEYAKDYHATGAAWNSSGPDGAAMKGGSAAAPAASSAASTAPTKSAAAPATGNLFAQLNKGGAVTSGLKKVDDSQKTHKNPNLRGASTVPSGTAAKTSGSSPKPAQAAAQKPPVFELQVKKWVVENQNSPASPLEIKEGDIGYTLYLYNCNNTTVILHPKINSITVEKCVKCNLIMKSGIISACEVINCKRSNLQADQPVPTVTIGSSDDINVYLSDKSLATEVVTSKTSGINVCLMPKDDKTELLELALPEQFVTKVEGKKLVTKQADIV